MKSSLTRLKKKKYEGFRKQYPDIKLSFLAESDLPREFYSRTVLGAESSPD